MCRCGLWLWQNPPLLGYNTLRHTFSQKDFWNGNFLYLALWNEGERADMSQTTPMWAICVCLVTYYKIKTGNLYRFAQVPDFWNNSSYSEIHSQNHIWYPVNMDCFLLFTSMDAMSTKWKRHLTCNCGTLLSLKRIVSNIIQYFQNTYRRKRRKRYISSLVTCSPLSVCSSPKSLWYIFFSSELNCIHMDDMV